MKIKFEVDVNTKYYELLAEYDYWFEKNIESMIERDGRELEKALKENRKNIYNEYE